MIPFPDLKPEIFSVELYGYELALRWYAVSYIVGFICALVIMKVMIKRSALWLNEQAPIDTEQADNLLTYLITGVILGGRLGYVFFYNFDYYLNNISEVVRVWDGGMSFHGGFLGVVVAVFLYARNRGVALWSLADLIAVASPPGLFLGRLANFINSELWGRPTNMPWGVIFPGNYAQSCDGIIGLCARHPTQLYEAFLEGILLFIILLVIIRLGACRMAGLVTGFFAVGYSLSRFVVEYYRVPDPQFFSEINPMGFAYSIAGFGVTMGQALCIPMFFAGIFLMLKAFSSRERI